MKNRPTLLYTCLPICRSFEKQSHIFHRTRTMFEVCMHSLYLSPLSDRYSLPHIVKGTYCRHFRVARIEFSWFKAIVFEQVTLKGACHEIFWHFFSLIEPIINRLKRFCLQIRFCENIRIFRKYFEKSANGKQKKIVLLRAVQYMPAQSLTQRSVRHFWIFENVFF